MKKLLALFLTILLAFTFTACGKGSTDNKSNTNSDTKNSETSQKVSTLEILYNSYQKYTSIGKAIEGKTKILSSKKDDNGLEIRRVYSSGSDSSRTTVNYNPSNNTLIINQAIVEFENYKPVRETDIYGNVITYTYDEKGNLIQTRIGSVVTKFEYLNNGKEVIETFKTPCYTSKYTNQYDDNGFLISKIYQFEDSSPKIYYYENNSEGRMLKKYTKNVDGEIERVLQENTYDKDGYLLTSSQ